MRTRRIIVLVAVIAMLLTASASLVQAAPLRGCLKYHQVQPGENLFRIGLQYNITVDVLMAANGISNPNLVYAGQSLCIPDGKVAPPPVPQTGGFYYTIKVGDTLSAIATRYGVSIYAIMRANNIANANFIYAGMIIWIPGSGGTTPGGTTYAQWKGEYFNNVDLSGTPSLVRNDGVKAGLIPNSPPTTSRCAGRGLCSSTPGRSASPSRWTTAHASSSIMSS